MQYYALDPNALLGGILAEDESQQIVQLALQKGNEIPPYCANAVILLIVFAGRAEIITQQEKYTAAQYDIIRLAANERHRISALEDNTLILAVKQFVAA